MYYYIFDVRKCKNRRQIEIIKDKLTNLGISGEFVIPDRIRSGKELAEQGIFKGYSTIVAIGADDLIDEVASAMLNKQQAFGIIPLQASENISKILNTNSWEEAAEALRFRKITETRVGILNEESVFFTYAEIQFDHPTSVTLEFEDYVVQARARDLCIANNLPSFKKKDYDKLDIIMHSVEDNGGGVFNKLKKMMFKPATMTKDVDLTLIREEGLRLFSPKQLPILVDGRIFAKTPATFGVSQKTIRLITKKASA